MSINLTKDQETTLLKDLSGATVVGVSAGMPVARTADGQLFALTPNRITDATLVKRLRSRGISPGTLRAFKGRVERPNGIGRWY